MFTSFIDVVNTATCEHKRPLLFLVLFVKLEDLTRQEDLLLLK